MRPRVIPCLLLRGQGLVKTVCFRNAKYVGDPVNTVKIFNEKEVDEIVILDITATAENRAPSMDLISEIAGEAFMPVAYGGGIQSSADAQKIIGAGIEKIVLNTIAVENPSVISQLADAIGSQSVVISVDVKKTLWGGFEVYTRAGRKATGLDPVRFCARVQELGAGEILLNAIDRDGTMQGYDVLLIKKVSQEVDIPVIACGGAGNLHHFKEALRDGGAAAVAAGSYFVFQGKHRAVLISYPTASELAQL